MNGQTALCPFQKHSVGITFLAWKALWGVRSASLLKSLPSLIVTEVDAEY